MNKLAPGRVVLDIVDTHDLNAVWGTILGVEGNRIRDNRPLGFCIARGWHISYGSVARCEPADAAAPHFLVDVQGATKADSADVVLTSGGLDFLQVKNVCLSSGRRMSASTDPISMSKAEVRGWSPLEGAFSWSDQKQASLSVCVDPDVTVLSFDLRAFRWPGGIVPNAILSAGGHPIEVRFDPAELEQQIEVSLPRNHPRDVSVTIDVPGATSPSAVGLSSDTRTLGVALYSVGAR